MSELEKINRALKISHSVKNIIDKNKNFTDFEIWEIIKNTHGDEYSLIEMMETFDNVKLGKGLKFCTNPNI